MNLSELFAAERGAQSRLAEVAGIPAPMLSQWASGARPIPIERCVAIERATGGKVMRWDLRPDDWLAIWPELARVKGAPEVPPAQAGSSGYSQKAQAAHRRTTRAIKPARNPDRSNTHRER